MGTTVVVDAQSNNVFPDVGRVAQAAGRVWLTGMYAFVNQPTGRDKLSGAYVCLTKPPSNPNLSCAIFSTGSSFDYEPDFKSYVTSYLTAGARLQCHLMERQLKDTSSVQVWMRPSANFPEVGKTYILVGNEGLSDQFEQAILVEEVVYELPNGLVTFYDSSTNKEYQRKIATLKFKGALRHTFIGPLVSQQEPASPQAVIRESVVSEGAARLYGIAQLTAAVEPNDYVLHLDTTKVAVVPASLKETIYANNTASNNQERLVPAASGKVEFTTALDFGPGITLSLGSPAVPGSVSCVLSGGATLTETAGQLYSGGTVVATVDSLNGTVSPVANSPLYTGSKTWSFTPAGRQSAPSQSGSIKVTTANRGKAWIVHLPLPPTPLSVEVDYFTGGDWLSLIEIGDGLLGGINPKAGSGQIDSQNTLSLTLGFLPDADTYIIYRFGVKALTKTRSGALPKAFFEFTTDAAISPFGLTLTWNDGIDDRTATDDGAGNITGDATGTVIYGQKRVRMYPTIIPPKGTSIRADITPRAKMTETFSLSTLAVNNNSVTFTLAHLPIPKTVGVDYVGAQYAVPPVYDPGPSADAVGILQ